MPKGMVTIMTKSALGKMVKKSPMGMTLAQLSERILQCLYYTVDEKDHNATFVISTDDLLKLVEELRDSIALISTPQEKRALAMEIVFNEILEEIKKVTEEAMPQE